MMESVEHIGIAVRDLDAAVRLYEGLLGTPCYKRETVATEKVRTAFFQVGTTKIELLESMDPDGAIGRFIAGRGEGLHHLAFEVADITEEMKRLSQAGFQLLATAPKEGADNKSVCFIHPKTANGVLIELCQERQAGSV